ncbi:hypothetical protein CBER1_03115 [Cercospora berteroae]|uniref:Uncharacterized protein n=1 Tax=Cercospora berteroae TaxID=357750 RepID=A0A2S6CK79_9PEZI|nr:hypothetical protein CBER1_03115 [Cercospora berteroae]
MPDFVSANFQRDITTIAAESRATIDWTTQGYEDKRRAFETAMEGDTPYQGSHEYLKGLRGLNAQFQARADELREENAAAAAALARLTAGNSADDEEVVSEVVDHPATPPRRRRRRDTQRGSGDGCVRFPFH